MQMIAHTIISIWPIDSAEFRKTDGVGSCRWQSSEIYQGQHPDRERSAMPIEQRINDLIASGLRPLGLDFGTVALQHWSRRIFDYMIAVYDGITFTPDISKIAFAKARKRRREND
jgi:hypothetical protein